MDVFALTASLLLDSSDYDRGLNSSESKLNKFSSKVKSGLKVVGAIGAATAAAGATAVGALAKESLEAYASYEQLVGGVDKLYGSASKKVQEYAKEAYKTAGMSANQYMETATSFSASLINSLSGDVNKAAELTDVAMRAMSDNVNVFGSNMEDVQNAFQGFAKQNYTMLDNLRLGYGGTKDEMKRLIEDANQYQREQGKQANLTMDSFADVIQAIQIIQEKQNIAGTTGKEAMNTIEGAANAAKAAWQNVIVAIGGGGDLDEAIKQFINSVFGEKEGEGLMAQVIPRLETIMKGIGEFVEKAAPYINEYLPKMLDEVMPALTSAVTALVTALLPVIPPLVATIIDAIGDALSEQFPNLSFIFDNLEQIVGGLIALFAGAEIISAIATLASAIGTVIELVTSFAGLFAAGGELMTTLGAFSNLFTVVIIPALGGFVTSVLAIAGPIAIAIAAITAIIAAGVLLIKNWDSIKEKIDNVVSRISEKWNQLVGKAGELKDRVVNKINDMANGAAQAFSNMIANATQWGSDLIGNFISGIGSRINSLINTVSNVANTVRSYLHFSEPDIGPLSDFHTYAPDMMELFAKGIRDNENVVKRQIESSFSFNSIAVPAVKQTNALSTIERSQHEVRTPKDITVILELDKNQLGKTVFTLNNEETQRYGTRLSGSYV